LKGSYLTRSSKEYRMPQAQPQIQLSPREKLLAHSASFLQWWDSPEARRFSEFLGDIRLRESKKLMESKDVVELHRAQGSIGIIDLIFGLKDDLRQYERDVLDKKIQPLREV
jgi:hypothetical protein